MNRAGQLSPQQVDADADTTVKDLLRIGAIAYPAGPAQLLGAVTRFLLVRLLQHSLTPLSVINRPNGRHQENR
jgi:hypothetical protein